MLIEAAWSYQYPARVAKKRQRFSSVPEADTGHRLGGTDSPLYPLLQHDCQGQEAHRGCGRDCARTSRLCMGNRAGDAAQHG